LAPGAPLGRVLSGHGNNGRDGFEGVRRANVIGTYLHGPLLPKNAHFADWLIATALGLERLAPLEDASRTTHTARLWRRWGIKRPEIAAALEFRQVSKTYPRERPPAIRSLSLEVPAGDICVLVGPRVREDDGHADGQPDGPDHLRRHPARRPERDDAQADELRREIGYAIQQIGLFPHETVADNIATVPKLLGWPSDRIRARVAELLDMVSLPQDMAERYPAQLSGGQRQRVGVARALAADPPLMLMDEPFGAIDPINRERLQNEFLRLQAEMRKTIVFVTHDIDEAIKMGDRIAMLQEGGSCAQYATPAELLLRPADDVRRGLRRCRPGAQEAGAAPRARRRPLEGAARPSRRPGGGGSQPGRRVRSPLSPAHRRRRQAAGVALGSRPGGRARARAGRHRTERRCSTRTRSCATRWPGCSRRTPSTGRWSMSAAGPRACSQWS
jgi:ABC-type nitrate/sulfonate/bicarbonate transport system ATPase subunit